MAWCSPGWALQKSTASALLELKAQEMAIRWHLSPQHRYQ